MKKKHYMLCITILIMIFIFCQSSLPAPLSQRESNLLAVFIANMLHISKDTASFAVRKCAHFLEYMVLGISLIHTVREWSVSSNRSDYPVPPGGSHTFARNRITPFMVCVSWSIAILYAVTDELHQIYVPGRSFGIRDIVIDSLGALTGIMIIKMRESKEEKRQ